MLGQLSLAVLLVATACHAELERVFLIQRHGARTPMAVIDGTLDCNLPYCTLSDQGKAQCAAIGAQFAKPYADTLGLDGYDVTKMHTISTSVPRVVESAEAAITAMYPTALPYVDFVPNSQDLQMSPWTSWPSWLVSDGWHRNASNMNTEVLKHMNTSTLAKLGEHYKFPEGLCTDPATVGSCASVSSDTFFCQLMQNVTMPPWLLALHSKMLTVRAVVLGYINGYFPSDPERNAVGSYGFPLASAMIQALTTEPTVGFNYKFIHRAAHDWTLVALYSALGLWTPSHIADQQFAIAFAESLAVERHSHPTGPDTLKAYRARPGQTYSADYSFAVSRTEVPLSCISADNVTTTTAATTEGCPIADVARFIATTAPASPAAECYATHEQLAAHECLTDDAPAAGSVCAFLRENCPTVPCAGDWNKIADATRGYACSALHEPAKDKLPLTAFGVTGGACAAGGIAAGIVAMIFGKRRLSAVTTLDTPEA